MILTDDPKALRMVRAYYRRRLQSAMWSKGAARDNARAAIVEIEAALRLATRKHVP